MIIERISPLTGKRNKLEIDVTADQLSAWSRGQLIQDAMPNLTPAEREFIMTGMLEDEFDSLFKNTD